LKHQKAKKNFIESFVFHKTPKIFLPSFFQTKEKVKRKTKPDFHQMASQKPSKANTKSSQVMFSHSCREFKLGFLPPHQKWLMVPRNFVLWLRK
jgi:hypothetical protein